MAVPKWAVEPAKMVARKLPFVFVEAVKFPREGMWWRFDRKSPGEPDASVVFLSLHKVASSFTHHMLTYLNKEVLGLTRMDWDGYAYNRFDTSAADWVSSNSSRIFLPTGHCYGVFRASLEIENFEQYRVLTVLRDPRDILTSWYYSDAYSHAEPLQRGRFERFEAIREQALSQTIDEYVDGARADYLEDQLEQYRTLLTKHGHTPLLYETMQLDWDTFMDQVEEQLKVEIRPVHRARLQELGGIGEARNDDVSKHRRKGVPGDFAEKLSPEAISRLNERFGPYLEWMGLAV